MASFSPASGSSLPSGADSLPVNITSSEGGSFRAFLRLADGSILMLEAGTIIAGTTHLRIPLPPGGAPPGSTLTVATLEAGGGLSAAHYSA